MRDYIERFNDPRMQFYRQVYRDSKRWAGEDVTNKHVLVWLEQGFGDQIQMLRYIPLLHRRRCKITIHAHKALRRLCQTFNVDVLDKEIDLLPDHDFHIASLSLPFVFGHIPINPYIQVDERFDLPDGTNIGIAWEGSPDHPYNIDRCVSLKYFKQYEGNLIHLQPEIVNQDLIDGCEDMKLYSVDLTDFYDTAKLINSVDYIVSVDTAVLHLAGAIGKNTVGLLGTKNVDPRWSQLWYPNIILKTIAPNNPS